MSREDAQVAFAAVIVGGHVASVQESGDALEAIAQPRLQALHVVVQPRVALVDDASESHAQPVSNGGVAPNLRLLGVGVPDAEAVTKRGSRLSGTLCNLRSSGTSR